MKDGIYTDISIEDYHANTTHVSATTLKYAKQSLKHYDYFRRGKIAREEKSQFGFGNAFELALLSPNEYLQKVAVRDEEGWIEAVLEKRPDLKNVRNSIEYKEIAAKFDAEQVGKYHIRETGPESFEVIEEMLSSCYQDATIQALIKNTEYQISIFWTDPNTGMKLKTRPDICKRKANVIVNLKTTLDGSPEAFTREMAKWDYPLQSAVEAKGCLESGLMDEIDKYFWLVCEKQVPNNATIYEYAELDLKASIDNLDFLLQRISKAEQENKWPGYTQRADNPHGILTAKTPMWYNF